jgi:CubicO group peptidase (beta-lactamase class C family)
LKRQVLETFLRRAVAVQELRVRNPHSGIAPVGNPDFFRKIGWYAATILLALYHVHLRMKHRPADASLSQPCLRQMFCEPQDPVWRTLVKIPSPLRSVLVVLSLACGLGSNCRHAAAEASTPTFPATELGIQCGKWFDAFNSGEYKTMQQMHRSTDPESVANRRALRDYQVFLMTRGVTPDAIELASPNTVSISGREKLSGNAVTLIVRGSAKSPISITEFGLRPAKALRSDPAKPRLSEIEALKDFDTMLTRSNEADEFSGAVLVAKDGRVLFKKAWGRADHATGSLNRTDTKFNLASAGKMFTGVSVLQLAQDGKLTLDDTVGKHLPEYANKDVREKVTIRHLLTHKSGLGEMFNAKYKAQRDNLRTVGAFVSLFEKEPLQFEPGSRWSYSNAGFCLLGAIVEKVSGEDYYQYLDKHIFRPAGMHNTGAYETDKPADNVAIGYTRDGASTPDELRSRRDNIKLHVVKGSPAGGSFSTVEDLERFAAALHDRQLLNDENTKLAMSAQAKTGIPGDASGYGFQIEAMNGHAIVGHRGGFPGISASFFMYPDDAYVVVVLSNYDSVAPVLALRMRDWIVSDQSPGKIE